MREKREGKKHPNISHPPSYFLHSRVEDFEVDLMSQRNCLLLWCGVSSLISATFAIFILTSMLALCWKSPFLFWTLSHVSNKPSNVWTLGQLLFLSLFSLKCRYCVYVRNNVVYYFVMIWSFMNFITYVFDSLTSLRFYSPVPYVYLLNLKAV